MQRPSTFSKNIIIRTTVTSLGEALDARDFRAVRVVGQNDGLDVVEDGYVGSSGGLDSASSHRSSHRARRL